MFLQLSAPAQYEVMKNERGIVVRLLNTSVNVKNNRRRLDTRYFITPVKHVDVRQDGLSTRVVVTLRREAEMKVEQKAAAGGYSMLVLEFGNDAAAAAPQKRAKKSPKKPPAKKRAFLPAK